MKILNLLLLLAVISSFMCGYSYHKEITNTEIEKVLEWDTKQIHSLGVAAVIQSHNADIIMQILNASQNLETKHVKKHIGIENLYNEDDKESTPKTFEQINKDQIEVDMGIRTLASNGLFQAEALHTILNILTHKDGNNLDFIAYSSE